MYYQKNFSPTFYQDDRQLETTLTHQWFGELPKFMPMRVNTDDMVFFKWPQTINPNQYMVGITANSTAGSTFRTIGPLKSTVELPFNVLDAYGIIAVIPKTDPRLPRFWSRLNRASTYTLPYNFVPGKLNDMQRSGVLTAAVTLDNLE